MKERANEVLIRPVVESDYVALLDLFAEFALFERMSEKMVNTVDRMESEKDYFNCLVVVSSDNRIVGYATYFYAYNTWTVKSMYDLYVSPIYTQ